MKLVRPFLLRLKNERKAGKEPFEVNVDFFYENYDQTYSHICGDSVDETWWKSLSQHIKYKIVSPEFLNKTEIQKWLSIPANKHDLFDLAINRLLNPNRYDKNITNRLRKSYSEITGKSDHQSSRAIVRVVAILNAGYKSSLGPQLEAVVGIIQANSHATHQKLDMILENTGILEDESLDTSHNTENTLYIEDKLEVIKKTRSFSGQENKTKIKGLADRVINGDLKTADIKARSDCIYWAARLIAPDNSEQVLVQTYLDWLEKNDVSVPTSIIYALQKEVVNEQETAIQILSDIDGADERASLFIILKRSKGNKEALKWYFDHAYHKEIEFFTGIGWANLAITLACEDRWNEAVELLKLKSSLYDSWPDLAYVEGIVNLALLLPDDYKKEALNLNIFYSFITTTHSEQNDAIREYADSCFSAAEIRFRNLNAERAEIASLCRTWLKLTSSDETIKQTTQKQLMEDMCNPRKAINLICIADTFNIEYEPRDLLTYLLNREKSNELSAIEIQAKLSLVAKVYAKKDLIEYYQLESEKLKKFINEGMLSFLLIKALLENKEYERARRTLEQDKNKHEKDDFINLSAMVKAAAGEDPLVELKLLHSTRDLIGDLHNIVQYLYEAEDWESLTPYLEELFNREKNKDNLTKLITCYQRDNKHTHYEILQYLRNNPDLVKNDSDLLSLTAWTHFNLGEYANAKEINDSLLTSRNTTNDLQLDINIAIHNGDWESFSYIVGREWGNRNNYNPQLLLRLAYLAAESDSNSDRAIELAKLSVAKEPNNPAVLINAYSLYFQLGRDSEVDPNWITDAYKYSTNEGPVWNANVKDIINETVPANREYYNDIEQKLNNGSISISMATKALNITNSKLFLEVPYENTNVIDGRLRTIIRIVSGNYKFKKIDSNGLIGLDLSSLFVLEFLGILKLAITALKKICIAPSTLPVLLDERRKVKFHQPSLVKKAEKIIALVVSEKLHVYIPKNKSPISLQNEVGNELADIMHESKINGGVLIHPLPIYKTGSFLEEKAELKSYKKQVISTLKFAKTLFEKSLIDSSNYDKSIGYLSAHDKDDSEIEIELDISKPIYLDELSITYLETAGLLDALCTLDLDLKIHQYTYEQFKALKNAGATGERLSNNIDNLKKVLKEGIEDNTITILPSDKNYLENDLFDIAPTLSQFLENTHKCSALSIDDGFLNKHQNVIDKKDNSIPIINAHNIARFMFDANVLTDDEYYKVTHRLRAGGFAFIFLDSDELLYHLRRVEKNNDHEIVETAEMRVLRQWIARIKSISMLNYKEESDFIKILQLNSILSIRNVISDKDIEIEHAIKLIDWVWKNIMQFPSTWIIQSNDLVMTDNLYQGDCNTYEWLLKPVAVRETKRQDAYTEWVNSTVLSPLLPSNKELLEEVAKRVEVSIDQLGDQDE